MAARRVTRLASGYAQALRVEVKVTYWGELEPAVACKSTGSNLDLSAGEEGAHDSRLRRWFFANEEWAAQHDGNLSVPCFRLSF
jgi:hypothetical protein